MTATISPSPTLEAVDWSSSSSPRLSLAPVGSAPALLDGAWWPRSRELSHELSALADVLDPLWGRITRIAVNPRYWPIIPQRIFVNGRVVKVGWFTTELDPHKILLLSGTSGCWDLLVIPPEATAPSAARLMAAASASTAPQSTATALMTAGQVDAPSTSHDADTGRPDRLAASMRPYAPPPRP
ncbi:DUF5994 family protein [Streptomyces sp. B6B3]|uniref:DUF5994 family protein n=1 Tax=Streptomyces sp. B6B3 TaxID=3153570 RepID=UPI00325DC27E